MAQELSCASPGLLIGQRVTRVRDQRWNSGDLYGLAATVKGFRGLFKCACCPFPTLTKCCGPTQSCTLPSTWGATGTIVAGEGVASLRVMEVGTDAACLPCFLCARDVCTRVDECKIGLGSIVCIRCANKRGKDAYLRKPHQALWLALLWCFRSRPTPRRRNISKILSRLGGALSR